MSKKMEIEHEKHFVFKDGQRAKNLFELKEGIEQLHEKEFEEFVNDSKNDFANWVKHVLNDHELAAKLQKEKTKKEIVNIIKNKCDELVTEENIFKVGKEQTDLHLGKKEGMEEIKKEYEQIKAELNAEFNEKFNKKRVTFMGKGFFSGVIAGLIIGFILELIIMRLF